MERLPSLRPLSRLNGGNTGKRGDLVTVEAAELRKLGQERAGDEIADPGHAGQQIKFGPPQRALLYQLVDCIIDATLLPLQAAQYCPAGALRHLARGPRKAPRFGAAPRHTLTP